MTLLAEHSRLTALPPSHALTDAALYRPPRSTGKRRREALSLCYSRRHLAKDCHQQVSGDALVSVDRMTGITVIHVRYM